MDYAYSREVGKRLRELRLQQKLTQEALAAKVQLAGCDLTRSALAEIEAGQRHLYPDELKAVCIALRIPAEELLP